MACTKEHPCAHGALRLPVAGVDVTPFVRARRHGDHVLQQPRQLGSNVPLLFAEQVAGRRAPQLKPGPNLREVLESILSASCAQVFISGYRGCVRKLSNTAPTAIRPSARHHKQCPQLTLHSASKKSVNVRVIQSSWSFSSSRTPILLHVNANCASNWDNAWRQFPHTVRQHTTLVSLGQPSERTMKSLSTTLIRRRYNIQVSTSSTQRRFRSNMGLVNILNVSCSGFLLAFSMASTCLL